MCSKESFFSRLLVSVFKSVAERTVVNNCNLVNLLSSVSEIFGKVLSKRIVVQRKAFFLVFNMISDFIVQP